MSVLVLGSSIHIYEAQLIKILDGDTIDASVNLGMGQYLNTRIRFLNIDAPEIYGVKRDSYEYWQGMKAKLFVTNWFAQCPQIFYIQSEMKCIYGRWLGEIWAREGEPSLNDSMSLAGYKSDYWGTESQKRLIDEWYESGHFKIWGKDNFIDGISSQIKGL